MGRSPLWIAQRTGQDWRDEASLAAIGWLTSTVPAAQWSARIERVRAMFEPARDAWPTGSRPPLYEPDDLIAWYVFQANAYAAARQDWVEHEAYRIAPVFRRLGQLLPTMWRVRGVEERAERLMTANRATPDNGIYEILVAGAYRVRGWRDVAFVPESATGERTPDLHVTKSRQSWAVECKRTGRSDYLAEERAAGERIAALALAEAERADVSLLASVVFIDEVTTTDERYLADRVADFLAGGPSEWEDERGGGRIGRADLRPLRAVLGMDDITFGASRMIELLFGEYIGDLDYSVAGAWTPAPGRPFHATAIQRASAVAWLSASATADLRKARHFRSVVADASGQLRDRPGVVHVGYETKGGNAVEGRRHMLNAAEMASFDPRESTIQWVYGNYMTPEDVTARLESAALSETTAPYRVRGRRRGQPLPSHMLFDDGAGAPGNHWNR